MSALGGSLSLSELMNGINKLIGQGSKASISELDEKIKQAKNSLKELKKAKQEVDDVMAKQEAQASISALNDVIKKLSSSINQLRNDVTGTNTHLKEMEKTITDIRTGGKGSGGSSNSSWFESEEEAINSVGLSLKELKQNYLDVKTIRESDGSSTTTYNDGLNNTVKLYQRATDEGNEYKVTLESINQEHKNMVSGEKFISSSSEALKRLGLNADEVLDIEKAMNNDASSGWTKAKQSIDANGDSVYELRNNLDKVVTVTQKNVNGAQQFSASLKNVTERAKEATKEAGTWGYSWNRAWQSFMTYQSVTEIFYRVKHTIMEMVDEVIELDNALLELRKVTDLSGASLDAFTEKAYNMAGAVAKTGSEMIDAATQFAKAGFDDNQILDLGQIALMYTNIADEEVSAADAAELLISQMKAFNITAKDSEHIIDAINEVSNNFAVSSADIANNLGKSSAVMANAGNSMEQYIGLMTAGTEITRNASKVANGLKTITLRLQGMNDEGEKDLELTSKMEGLFNKLSLSVYKADGSLKNTYELLGDLASVYPDLTEAQKAYVTETIAGKYQAQNAAAILSNWKTAVEATTTALDSNGSAAAENAKYLDSIQGKIKNFQAAFESLSKTLFSSNLVKFFVDFGTALLNIANTGFVSFVTKAGAIIIALKLIRSAYDAVNPKIKQFNLLNTQLVKTLTYVMQKEQGLGKLLYKVSDAYRSATAEQKQNILANEAAAAKQALVNLAITGTIMVLTSAISAYNNYISKMKQVRAETIENALTNTENLKEQEKQLRELAAEYDELYGNGGVGNNKETLALQESINNLLKERQESVDLINSSYKEQKKILDDILDNIDSVTKSELERAKIVAEQEMKEADKGEGPLSAGASISSKYQLVAGTLGFYDYDDATIEEKIENFKKLQDYLTKAYNNSSSELQKKTYSEELDVISDSLTKLEEAYNKYKEISDKIDNIKNKEILKDEFNLNSSSTLKDIDNFIESVKESDKYTDEQKQSLLETAQDVYPQYSKSIQAAIDDLNGMCSAGNSEIDVINATVTSFEELDKVIDKIQSAYDVLTNAIDEYNEQGYFSLDTLQSLNSLGGEYLQYLFDENGQLNLNEEAMRRLAIAQLEKMQATALDESLNYAQQLAEEGTEVDNEKTKVDELKQAIIELNAEKAKGLALDLFGGDKSAYEKWESNYNKTAAYINQIQNTINKLSMGTGVISSSSRKGSSSSSSKEWWEIEFENIKNQFSRNETNIGEYIQQLQNLLNRLGKGTDAWHKINEELQKQRLAQVEDDYKRGTISLDIYINKLKELIKVYREGTEAWNNLADKIKKALQDKADNQKDELAVAEKAALGIINEEIDKLKELKEEQEDYYDKLIDEKKKANDETERELELARLQEALANARREKTKKVWVEGLGWQWTTDQQAINEAQKALDDFNNEQAIKDLEKQKEEAVKVIDEQIDAWEKYRESWEDVADDYETQQARMVLSQQLGADAEANILQKRLDVLEDYKNKYLATMAEINNLENTTSTALMGGTGASSTPVAATTSRSYTVQAGDTLSAIGRRFGMNWQDIYNANRGIIGNNPDLIRIGQNLTIPGFSTGGVVDYTGLAMLHGSKDKPEYVLNNDQMKSMLTSLFRPQVSAVGGTSSGAVNNYNFGDLVLPNVKNAQQFVTELKSIINISKH